MYASYPSGGGSLPGGSSIGRALSAVMQNLRPNNEIFPFTLCVTVHRGSKRTVQLCLVEWLCGWCDVHMF